MKEYKNSTMFRLIDEYIHNARDRRIMKDRLINGVTIEELSARYEMSVSQVQRKVQDYQKMLEDYLETA